MSNVHELKTDPEVFDAVWRGDKTHEIRLNDRDYRVGDSLFLRETLYTGAHMKEFPTMAPLTYTGREMMRKITHILSGYGLQENWVILSLAPTQSADARPVPYLASLDCPYSSVSEDIKCAWADGWNQCVQATGSSTRVRMPKINFSALYMRLFNSKNFRELEWKDVSEQSGVGSVPITRLAMGRSIEKQHVDKLIDWLENSSPMPFEKGADARPVAIDAHKFALMCDALPADFSWGDPLTPDVFRHIESALATAEQSRDSVIEECAAILEKRAKSWRARKATILNGRIMADELDEHTAIFRALKSQQDAAIESRESS